MSPIEESDINDGIKELAQALRSGGTLLNIACPVCNHPLIKIEDKIFCKVCNKEVVMYKDEAELPAEIQQELKRPIKQPKLAATTKMEKTIIKKIEGLRKKLDKSDEPDEIIKLSNAIDKLHDTLKKIQE
jgi:uncharacterized Zn finger protein (UPF0148 family)